MILDSDLATLFEVPTKHLNQQVKRNRARFPEDFMLVLTLAEKKELLTYRRHDARLRYSPVLPNAFTEHGAIMAASILNSRRAVDASIFVVRAFVKLRGLASSHELLSRKVEELDERLGQHDGAIRSLMDAIKRLAGDGDCSGTRRIGFHPAGRE